MTESVNGLCNIARVALLCLRRSAGKWAVPVIATIEAVNLSSRNQIWAAEFEWALSWSCLSVAIAAPVLAGVAAVEFRVLRLRSEDIAIGLPRGGLALHASRVAALWTWVAGVHLLAVIVAGGMALSAGAAPTTPVSNWLLPVVAALSALGAWIAIGAWVGWASPHLLSVIAVVAVSLAVNIGIVPISPLTLVRVGGSTSSILGLEWRIDVVGTQVVWAAALALLAVAAMTLRRSERTGRVLGASATLVAVGAAAQLIAAGGIALARAPQPVPQVCEGEAPTVCVTAPHRSQLHAVHALYSGLKAVTRATPHVSLPARIEQATERDPAGRVGPDLQRIPLPSPSDVYWAQDTAFQLVLSTAGCPPQLSLQQARPGMELASTVATWMLVTADLPHVPLGNGPDGTPSEDEARRNWMRLASCDWVQSP